MDQYERDRRSQARYRRLWLILTALIGWVLLIGFAAMVLAVVILTLHALALRIAL